MKLNVFLIILEFLKCMLDNTLLIFYAFKYFFSSSSFSVAFVLHSFVKCSFPLLSFSSLNSLFISNDCNYVKEMCIFVSVYKTQCIKFKAEWQSPDENNIQHNFILFEIPLNIFWKYNDEWFSFVIYLFVFTFLLHLLDLYVKCTKHYVLRNVIQIVSMILSSLKISNWNTNNELI